MRRQAATGGRFIAVSVRPAAVSLSAVDAAVVVVVVVSLPGYLAITRMFKSTQIVGTFAN